MTEKVFLKDSYIKSADAIFQKADDSGLVFDKTIFYATGGGQPNDTGTIKWNGSDLRVIDVTKKDDDVFHRIEGDVKLSPGDRCHMEIDWNRRYSHMRYHTAIHIIDAVVHHNPENFGLITGSQIYQDRARVDFDFQDFTREIAQKIIDEANRIISEGHPVKILELDQAKALSIEGLARTAPGRELLKRLDVVRVIEIEGVDMQADGGTHVNNTREVGALKLSGIESKGRRNKRLNITLS